MLEKVGKTQTLPMTDRMVIGQFIFLGNVFTTFDLGSSAGVRSAHLQKLAFKPFTLTSKHLPVTMADELLFHQSQPIFYPQNQFM